MFWSSLKFIDERIVYNIHLKNYYKNLSEDQIKIILEWRKPYQVSVCLDLKTNLIVSDYLEALYKVKKRSSFIHVITLYYLINWRVERYDNKLVRDRLSDIITITLLFIKEKQLLKKYSNIQYDKTIIYTVVNENSRLIEILNNVSNLCTEKLSIVSRKPYEDSDCLRFQNKKDVGEHLQNIPIYINKEYGNWLLFELLESYEKFELQQRLLSNEDIKQKIDVDQFKRIKDGVEQLYNIRDKFTNPVYFKYKCDWRGRIYPCLTEVSFISHYWLRILFRTKEKSDLYFTEEIILKLKLYWKEKGVYNNFEHYWIIKFITIRKRLPLVEYDAKCSGYQNFSILFGYSKLYNLLGLSIREDSEDDIYTTIANKFIKEENKIKNTLNLKYEEKFKKGKKSLLSKNWWFLKRFKRS